MSRSRSLISLRLTCTSSCKPLAALAVLADARTQVGRLLGQHVDLLLAVLGPIVEQRQRLAQIDQVAVQFGQAAIQVGDLFAQFAQFALARQNAGLGVMRADRQRAVRFQQFAAQRDEAMARRCASECAGRREIADDQRAASKLRGQIGQFGMVARAPPARPGR